MEDDRRKEADRYRKACSDLGLSLEAMARELGFSLSTSQRYASGKSPVTQRTWKAIETLKTKRKKR